MTKRRDPVYAPSVPRSPSAKKSALPNIRGIRMVPYWMWQPVLSIAPSTCAAAATVGSLESSGQAAEVSST
eukprot:CAMPEP_0194055490 /NCGR_PEP_ID=MMETSP0009_2-20130614/56944_1 /TAXON_ID=210454 /ORGANISM="Grammatophora oceanica, Strain CCMP 410" /LENGTH=70 /DNA_ID=CAMNT_0038704415 /DNA_START=41 /DNA_END=249 /DNA_ORIENTATION=+